MSYAFISYVRENRKQVDKLCKELTKHGIKAWLDRNDIKPGARWQDAIEEAIQKGNFFIACFSKEYNRRDETHMNEELTLAIDRLRKLSDDQIWFIPIKLNECEIPKRRISDVEKLTDFQWVELHKDWDVGIQQIIDVIHSTSKNILEHDKGKKPSNIRSILFKEVSENYKELIRFIPKGTDQPEIGSLLSALTNLSSSIYDNYLDRLCELEEEEVDSIYEAYRKVKWGVKSSEQLWLPPKSRPKIDQNKVDHYPSVAL